MTPATLTTIDKHIAANRAARLSAARHFASARCPKAEVIRDNNPGEPGAYGMDGMYQLISMRSDPANIKRLICDNIIAMRRNRVTLQSQGRSHRKAGAFFLARIEHLRKHLIALPASDYSWHQMTTPMDTKAEATRYCAAYLWNDETRVVQSWTGRGWIVQAWREDD